MRGLYVAVVIVAAGSLLSTSARAQESDDDLARAHFSSGRAYYERGRYEDAAREFLEAYRLSSRAELLDNASRAYERALLFDEAIATLEQMRREHPESDQGTAIDERIANLERLRERVRGERDAPVDEGDAGDAAPPPESTSETGGGTTGGQAIVDGMPLGICGRGTAQQGETCTSNADCFALGLCQSGVCHTPCASDTDCPTGSGCVDLNGDGIMECR